MEYKISGHTQLYCLIGSPVGHSLSPAMYNYSFSKVGIDAVYLAFDLPLEKLKDGVVAAKTLHVKGFNVTMPCKTAIMEYLDEITPAAKLIGACNTVTVSEEGKLTGYNTDCIGFANNLRSHGIEMKGKKIILMGAGGAATAICVQAALDGALEVSVFNRKDEFFENGVQLIKRVSEAVPSCKVMISDIEDQDLFKHTIQNGDILINATKIGMKPFDNGSLVSPSLLHPELVVADTVYNPQETRLIKDARKAGCKAAIGGIGMLLWQGVAAFKLFTGHEMPRQELQDKFFRYKGVAFMQQFMLCVTYTTNPGMREKFIKEINSRGLLDKILKEDGCLEYEYYLSVKNADDVLLVERWESEELQQVHLKQIHMEELKSIKERYISGVSVRKSFLE